MGLSIFALVILLVLLAVGIGVWVLLGMMPGRIAKSRNHPQAEAINVCGWMGAITMGLLSPLAYIWAYTKPNAGVITSQPDQRASEDNGEASS